MNNIVVCISGASGTGKTTVAGLLHITGKYTEIESYTTRSRRYHNEVGHVFDCVQPSDYFLKNQTLAWTEFDGNYYWTVPEDVIDKGAVIYVITPESVSSVIEKCDQIGVDVIHIHLIAPAGVRTERMMQEGRSKEDVSRRLVHDIGRFFLIGGIDLMIDTSVMPLQDIVDCIDQFVEEYAKNKVQRKEVRSSTRKSDESIFRKIAESIRRAIRGL